jgi:acetyl-CoA carboxylase biotin carboxyl carrier protein
MSARVEATLAVRCEPDPAGAGLRVLAPAIGIWSDPPALGALVSAGSAVGTLARLNARFVLTMPAGVAGRVGANVPRDRALPVEFGQTLFHLAPLAADVAEAQAGAVNSGAGEALPAGTWAVVSPTDGTFYRSPKPGSEPFVEVGSQIEAGQPVGLVEVMKTFNRVLYGGGGLPERARVVEIRCSDAAEVHAGQILFLVR